MRTKLIRIGNSRGVRLPAAVIAQCGFDHGEVELHVRDNAVVIEPVRNARQGWDAAFAQAADQPEDDPALRAFRETAHDHDDEWKW